MKQQLNEIRRMQQLAGLANLLEEETPAPGEKQTGDAPMISNKKNDLSKIEFRDAFSQTLEKNKKKYFFRININGKPKVSVFVDSPDISEKEAKTLFADWKRTSGQFVIGPEGAKVEFQVVDTA